MYIAEKTLYQLHTTKHKFKTLFELAKYCAFQVQNFQKFNRELFNFGGSVDESTDLECFKLGYQELQYDGKTLKQKYYICDATVEALEEFLNNHCEIYRIKAHYKLKETKSRKKQTINF